MSNADRLRAQADALERRARDLAREASELRREAADLRDTADRMTRAPLRIVNGTEVRNSLSLADRVFNVLTIHGSLAVSDVSDALNVTPARARQALEKLREAGKITRSGVRSATRYRVAGDDGQNVTDEVNATTYAGVVRDAIIGLDTFDFAALREALPDMARRTVKRWLDHWVQRGIVVAAGDGRDVVYAYVRPDGDNTQRRRHEPPEVVAAREAAPTRQRGDVVIGTGATGRPSSSKNINELAREARRHGVRIEVAGSGHLAWMCPSGEVVTSSSTPAASGTARTRKALRKAGVPV